MKIIKKLRSIQFIGLMILLTMNAKSQIPAPIAYYDFEGDAGDVVIDKSDQGNDAEVVRPVQTILGINGGAPAGSSPATAADFQDGLLNVPGIGLGNVINGSGSYTFTA
ncbi:MAG: hypothetical protein VX646_10650, partial [Verrucomicrobiota bacterium]|nr:hypothetical protein [Verrucomicrobiota bacterium]